MTEEVLKHYKSACVIAIVVGVIVLSVACGVVLWTINRAHAQVEARSAIEQVISEIIFAQDRHDGRAFASHFLPDGLVRITETDHPLTAQGSAALQAFASGPAAGAELPFSSAPGDIHHVVTNSALKFLDDDHAKHRAYYVALARDKTGKNIVFVQMGSFEDTFVRHSGRWLIAEHHIRHRGGVADGG